MQKSKCKIIPSVCSQSWKWKKDKKTRRRCSDDGCNNCRCPWALPSLGRLSVPGRCHFISSWPQPRDVGTVTISVWQMRNLRLREVRLGPESGASRQRSAEPGCRPLCWPRGSRAWSPGSAASWRLPQGDGSVWALCSDSLPFYGLSKFGGDNCRDWISKGKSWKIEGTINKWGESASSEISPGCFVLDSHIRPQCGLWLFPWMTVSRLLKLEEEHQYKGLWKWKHVKELKALGWFTCSTFLKPRYFLLYVVMTQKDFVVFTEESTSLLQRHQRMLVDSCLFIGGLGHTQ